VQLHHTHAGPDDGNLFLAAARLPLEGYHVLVVDDDDAAREVLQTVLEAEGADVVTANSAAVALKEIERTRPDIMFADIGMPVVDGFTMVEQLRQRPADRGGETPVAALTGYISHEDRARAKRAGFQAYLLKPVDPTELIDTVRALAGGKECTPAPDQTEVPHA
jgi:CheY-like chemotaxis protein